jgi:DNA repair protein SbcC/Rad50
LWQQEQSQLQKGAQEQEKLAAEAGKLEKQKGETAAKLAIAQQKVADLASQQERLGQLREEQSGLQAQQEILTEEGKKRNERIEKLKAAEEEDRCPLCGQPLTADHKAEVIAELEAEVASKRETYRHIRKRLPEIEKEAAELAKTLAQRGVQEGQLQKLQQQLATAEARLAEIGRAVAGWAESGGTAGWRSWRVGWRI